MALQLLFPTAMALLRVVLVLIWVAAFLSGRALFDVSTAVSDGVALRTAATTPRVSARSTVSPSRAMTTRPRLDLYGNPIDAAITDYRIDGRGELYERHAPDTALLKLKSPGA